MLKKFLIGTFVALAFMLVASSASADCSITTTLKVGSKGAEVSCLQTKVGATSDGSFGPMTKASVMAYQASHGLSADGVVGPLSRAVLNGSPAVVSTVGCPAGASFNSMTGASCAVVTSSVAGCAAGALFSATTGASCTTGAVSTGVLGGKEGSLSNTSEVSTVDSKIKEGATSQLLGFTTEVSGDVSVDRIDIYLNSLDASTYSDNADDYFKSASLLVNGTKVATVNVADFTEDTYNQNVTGADGDANEYRIRFSGLNQVFANGAKPKFVVAFEAISTIDGTDLAQTWGAQLAADSIRYVDGKGFSDTEGSTSVSEIFTSETEDVAKLSINSSSNNPELTTFKVSSTGETKDEVVFKFNVEEQNDVDVTVDDMTITLTTSAETDRSVVISSADLYKGSTLLGSESVPANGVVAFTDMGLDISAGGTAELTLKLTFTDNTAYAEGTTVYAVVTSIDAATDTNGNDEGDMTKTGTGLASATHILRSTGISVAVKSATSKATAFDGGFATAPDTTTFTWVFDVTAFGDSDVYINSTLANIVVADSTSTETVFTVGSSTGNTLTGLSGTLVESDADVSEVTAHADWDTVNDGNTFFKINKGTTGTFTLTVTGTNATDAKQVRGLLQNIEWTTSDVAADPGTDPVTLTVNDYIANLGTDAATPFVYVD